MAFEHPSGVAGAYDRSASRPGDARLVVIEGAYVQGAEINELQAIEARRNRRIGDMVARDGNRIEGGALVLTAEDGATTGTLSLADGKVYVLGDVRDVAAAVIADVPLVGSVSVGVRLTTTVVTAEDDPTLLGLGIGTVAEGEPGAAREVETLAWALEDDAGGGRYFQVYALRDGTALDQAAPSDLTGVKAVVAEYDRDAHGSYIVSGCEVTALGAIAGAQVFSIQPGTANILGWKRTRVYALRHAEPEAPDLETIAAETHAYPATVPAVITLNDPPAASITQVVIQKEITETVVRGTVPGGIDALAHTSVVAIDSIVQGATTFGGATYALAADAVSWAPSGAEPAASSTYQVTYRYNVAVIPDTITDRTITVSGGVVGTSVLVTYASKLPRRDLLCLTAAGDTAYVKGVSARKGAMAPLAPTTLLKLAEIGNDWLGTPEVINDGIHNVPYDKMARYFGRLVDMLDSFNRLALESDIRGRSASATRGIFTDPLTDDYYRDQGEPQTAAIVDGCLVLAVDLIDVHMLGTEPYCLPCVPEVVVSQPLATSAMRINPYSNLISMPADMKIEPAVDFWTDRLTEWTSPTTAEFTVINNTVPAGTVTSTKTITEVVAERVQVAKVLRRIAIRITLDGFGVGEHLATLTFDGVDIKPAGVQTADGDGKIIVNVTVPEGIPTGTRRVRATGAAGSFAEALFVGQGTILVDVLRRVTLLTRTVLSPPPVRTPVDPTKPIYPPIGIGGEGGGGGGGGDGAGGEDPLAQTYRLAAARQIIGVDIRFAAIGVRRHGVRVQLSGVSDGDPTSEVYAQAFIGMAPVATGVWVSPRFAVPVYQSAADERAMVILTDDTTHALAIAKLGDIVNLAGGRQSVVTEQPYTVGVLLSSSNRSTWTAHNDRDLTFQVVAARYTATERVVVLGTIDLVAASDMVVRGTVEIPTEDCSVVFEVVRADGSVIAVVSGQTIEFSDYVTETVTVRARLKGTATMSPILWPGVSVGVGRIRASGDYVTKAFAHGAAVDLYALFVAHLPAGSTVAVARDAADDVWSAVPLASTEVLPDGWTEPKYHAAGITAAQGRVKITLTGSPAARPQLARVRAYTL